MGGRVRADRVAGRKGGGGGLRGGTLKQGYVPIRCGRFRVKNARAVKTVGEKETPLGERETPLGKKEDKVGEKVNFVGEKRFMLCAGQASFQHCSGQDKIAAHCKAELWTGVTAVRRISQHSWTSQP